MKLLRHLAFTLAAAGLAVSFAQPAFAQAGAAPAPLAIKTYSAAEASFFVSSTLVTGATEAVLINGQFSRSNAHRVVADVLESGKRLTTVFVSAGDPDYYFGLPVIQAAFPEARIVTTPAIGARIDASLAKKLAFWGPRLGANGPGTAVLPKPIAETTLKVDGQPLEIRTVAGDAYHAFVWIPSLQAVVGGVDVFGPGMHVWTADEATPAKRDAWRARLAAIEALRPTLVVPGHFVAGKNQGTESLAYTRGYLDAIDAEAPRAANGAALIEAMQKRYPQAQLGIALDIGAKVVKGEMTW